MDSHELPVYKIYVEIPFATERLAEIVFDVMRVDAEPKRSKISRDINIKENVVNITLLVAYLCWVVTPDTWLNYMNIYYYPQKYWAVAVPVQCLVALTMFAFFIYPGLNLAMTPNVADVRTVTDHFASKSKSLYTDDAEGIWCDCGDSTSCHLRSVGRTSTPTESRIPSARDLDMRDVCKLLYSK